MDSRIKALVEKSGYKHEAKDGFFKFVFALDGDRTQMVLVDADPDTFGDAYADFDVCSIICEESELTGDKALKLLKAMENTKAGAVKLRQGLVVLNHDLAANASVETFKLVVAMVAIEADKLEALVESKGSKDRF